MSQQADAVFEGLAMDLPANAASNMLTQELSTNTLGLHTAQTVWLGQQTLQPSIEMPIGPFIDSTRPDLAVDYTLHEKGLSRDFDKFCCVMGEVLLSFTLGDDEVPRSSLTRSDNTRK